MATILDAGLFSFMVPFFIFLFTFVVLYALLSKTKILGENQTMLNLIASICISVVAVFTGSMTGVISAIAPWIVFLIIVLVFLFALFQFFGIDKNKEIWDYIGGPTVVYIIVLVIVLIGLSQVFEAQLSPFVDANGTVISEGKTVKSEVIQTITHPRLLGAIFILVTSGFAIKLLVDKPTS